MVAIAGLMASACVGCSGTFRPFPLKDPTWVDNDKRSFDKPPEEYFSSFYWDGADQMMVRPFTMFWKVDPAGEAVNVNAMDEVPNSAWFTNRIGRFPTSLERAAKGQCRGPSLDPNKGPWIVTGAKPNGANPGFPIKASDGRRYMVKFDGVVQGPRATAADVIVSKMYYAAGYETPCNEVVLFDRSVLRIKKGAKKKDSTGKKVPVVEEDLDKVFSKAIRLPDGRYRASVSLFVKGKPIGPFRYEGTRSDDPNDVVKHEERRELRASYVIGAWTNHTDAREQNTLDMFVKTSKARGYIQHNIIDFGDCFGSVWEPPLLGRRIGHSHYLAVDHVVGDFLTLGMIKRPWDEARFGKSGRVWGYYAVNNFVPDEWRPGYPNPAMLRMSERDAAWMARIMARMTPAHIKAMIAEGKVRDRALVAELTRIVLGRRMKVLGRYLSKLSALTDPVVKNGVMCLEDLAVSSGVVARKFRRYGSHAWATTQLEPVKAPLTKEAGRNQVCVSLPAVDGASGQNPRYLVVDVLGASGSQAAAPARVHLYHLGGDSYKVVGLERPHDDAAPTL